MATNVNVGSAYLTVIPSARGFVRKLRRELRGDGFDKLGEEMGDEIVKGFKRAKLADNLKRIARDSVKSLSSLGRSGLFDAVIASGVVLVSTLAPLAGLLVAVPGLALAAGAALGALALAMSGVGTVLGIALTGDLEGFNEGLKELTPSAAKAVGEIGSTFLGLKDIAQEAFFGPVATAAEGFSKTMAGPVKRSIVNVATAMGQLVAETVAWAQSSEGAAALEKASEEIARFLSEAGAGIPALLQGLLDLTAVTIGDLGPALARTFERWGAWLSEVANDGSAQRWFDTAMQTAREFLQVLENVGRTLLAIFQASSSGGGLLDTIVGATAAMAEWSESAEGQQALNDIFQFFGTVVAEVFAAVGILVGGLSALAGWFNTINPQAQDATAKFIAWMIVLGPLTSRITAIITLGATLVRVFILITKGIIAASVAVAKFVVWLSLAIARMAVWAATMIATAARATAAWVVAASRQVAALATATAAMARNAALQVAIGLRMAAASAAAAARVVASWALMAARALVQGAIIVAALLAQVGAWILLGIQALIQGARVALGWLLALGPIGIIIAVVIALVALIIMYWDEIIAALTTAWNWIKDVAVTVWTAIKDFFVGIFESVRDFFIQLLIDLVIWWIIKQNEMKALVEQVWNEIKDFFKGVWEWIIGYIQTQVDAFLAIIEWFGNLPGMFWDWFSGVVEAVSDNIEKVLEYMRNSPNEIISALGNLGTLLWNAGKDLIQGFLDGIESMWNTVKDTLGNLTDMLPDWKGPESTDKSILFQSGEWVIGGFAEGLRSSFPVIRGLLSDFTSEIGTTTQSNLSAVTPAAAANGITIENVNVVGADNRFDMDALESQVKMRV